MELSYVKIWIDHHLDYLIHAKNMPIHNGMNGDRSSKAQKDLRSMVGAFVIKIFIFQSFMWFGLLDLEILIDHRGFELFF